MEEQAEEMKNKEKLADIVVDRVNMGAEHIAASLFMWNDREFANLKEDIWGIISAYRTEMRKQASDEGKTLAYTQ